MTDADDIRIPFGKYQGTRIGDVPASYLIWLLEQGGPDRHPEIRDYIEEHEDDLRLEIEQEKRFGNKR